MKPSRTDYILAELRAARLRAQLWQADIESIGIALKAGWIDCQQAIECLHECDALRLVGTLQEASS